MKGISIRVEEDFHRRLHRTLLECDETMQSFVYAAIQKALEEREQALGQKDSNKENSSQESEVPNELFMVSIDTHEIGNDAWISVFSTREKAAAFESQVHNRLTDIGMDDQVDVTLDRNQIDNSAYLEWLDDFCDEIKEWRED